METLLTFWPPGPPERTKDSSQSDSQTPSRFMARSRPSFLLEEIGKMKATIQKEMINTNRVMYKIDQEVHILYLESLKTKIDLLGIKIKSLNIELYIEINKKNSLHGVYVNLLFSLDYHKKNVDKLIKVIISEIIDDADVIAATAVSSCHCFLDDTIFDVIIMDEASQVASFMSLLPLLKCKKFVLVIKL